MSNLVMHPRCNECGVTMEVFMVHRDHVVYQSPCKHGKRMAFYHNGSKVEHCLFCAGTEFIPDPELNEIPCPYCAGKMI